MIVLLLIQKIASLFLILGVGFALVRLKLVKAEDSKVLSKVLVYAVCPCAILSALQVELSSEVVQGFLLAFGAAIAIQLLQMLIVRLIARPLHLSGLEKMASVYSNCGNLIIPLVGFCLGDEWVIYSLAYMMVQGIGMWSHGKALIEGTTNFEPKKVFGNINIIVNLVGLVLFALNIRFSGPIEIFLDDVGALLGPCAMLIAGMLVGGQSLKAVFTNRRVWLVTFLRLIALPAVVCLGLKLAAGFIPVENATAILMITMLGAVTPTASTSVNLSQVYGTEAELASAINVFSTLCCIVTMPIWTFVYTM